MCWCRPEVRTPNCGRVECHPPKTGKAQPQTVTMLDLIERTRELEGIMFDLRSDLRHIVEAWEAHCTCRVCREREGAPCGFCYGNLMKAIAAANEALK